MNLDRMVLERRTDSPTVPRVCVRLTSAKSIARAALRGSGDGLQPAPQNGSLLNAGSLRIDDGDARVSFRAIAAALALEDVSVGERLTAFSLASYANRSHRAWPAARTAASRAGLSRRQYLLARDRLAQGGLIEIERAGVSSVAWLRFAEDGPSIEHEVNAELFEAVLARSPSRGGGRVLLAALAALSDADGVVQGLSSEELSDACGLSDRTYRRARSELLAGSEVVLEQSGGGRGHRNVWRILDATQTGSSPRRPAAPRPTPAPGQMPLVAVVRSDRQASATAEARPSADVGPAPHSAPAAMGNSGRNPGVNPGQNRTPRASETPAQTPAETPPPEPRAGREPKNQTTTPPDPPRGGPSTAVAVIEHFESDRGRRRQRMVSARAGELCALSAADHDDWRRFRDLLRHSLGCSAFEIWLADYVPIACSDVDQALLVAGCRETHQWVAVRYRDLFNALSARIGRTVRPATERELALHDALASRGPAVRPGAGAGAINHDHEEAV